VNRFTEMTREDLQTRHYRWDAELFRGKLRRSGTDLLVLNETDSYPLMEQPLAFGIGKEIEPKKCVLTGVFRELVDYHEAASVNLYRGLTPPWYQSYLDLAEQRKQYFENRQRGKEPPELGPSPLKTIGWVDGSLAYLFGDRLIFLSTPDFEKLQIAKPLRLSTTEIQQGIWDQPISFQCAVENQNGSANVQLNCELSGIELDRQTNRVTVDPKAVWRSYCQQELARAPTMSSQRYGLSSKAVASRRSYFEILFGRQLSGTPMCATIKLVATDENDYTSSLSRTIIFDIPDSEYETLLDNVASRKVEYKEQQFFVRAFESYGDLPQRLVDLPSPISAEQGRVDAMANNVKEIDKLHEKLVQQTEQLVKQIEVDRDRLQQLSSRLAEIDVKGVEEAGNNYQEQVDNLASLRAMKSWNRVLPWIGLVPASLFYFSSLYFLFVSRMRPSTSKPSQPGTNNQ